MQRDAPCRIKLQLSVTFASGDGDVTPLSANGDTTVFGLKRFAHRYFRIAAGQRIDSVIYHRRQLTDDAMLSEFVDTAERRAQLHMTIATHPDLFEVTIRPQCSSAALSEHSTKNESHRKKRG